MRRIEAIKGRLRIRRHYGAGRCVPKGVVSQRNPAMRFPLSHGPRNPSALAPNTCCGIDAATISRLRNDMLHLVRVDVDMRPLRTLRELFTNAFFTLPC